MQNKLFLKENKIFSCFFFHSYFKLPIKTAPILIGVVIARIVRNKNKYY